MLRGTKILTGIEAQRYRRTCEIIRETLLKRKYSEVVLPAMWEQETFINKAGKEILSQMYVFNDRKKRKICLIPEVTALIQERWNAEWKNIWPKPAKVFYIQRCYRYEKPQKGRYREFTQAGVEILGGKSPLDRQEAIESLRECLDVFGVNYNMNYVVKRGLSYYIEDGFEAEVESLGAQKQVAGGGRYAEGIGWAIGVDRLILC